MLRRLAVLLLILNMLVLSWTMGIFARWGWGPAQPLPETQAQAPIAADALHLQHAGSPEPTSSTQ